MNFIFFINLLSDAIAIFCYGPEKYLFLQGKKMVFSHDRVTTKTVKKLKIVKLKMSIVILGHYMKSVITE